MVVSLLVEITEATAQFYPEREFCYRLWLPAWLSARDFFPMPWRSCLNCPYKVSTVDTRCVPAVREPGHFAVVVHWYLAWLESSGSMITIFHPSFSLFWIGNAQTFKDWCSGLDRMLSYEPIPGWKALLIQGFSRHILTLLRYSSSSLSAPPWSSCHLHT